MDAVTIGIVICLCLVLASVGFTWMKYRESAAMDLIETTFNKIKTKTPAEAMPIVRRAYPGTTISVFNTENTPAQYHNENAVRLIIDATGRINGFDRPRGEGWRSPPNTTMLSYLQPHA